MRKKNEKIDKLKAQVDRLEAERNMLKESERVMEEKVNHTHSTTGSGRVPRRIQ